MDSSSKKSKKSLFDFVFFKKLKSIKHIEVILAIIVGVIIVLLYLSSSTKTKSNAQSNNQTQKYSTINEYSKYLENDLENVLSNIEGAGNVEIMLVFDVGVELVIAYSTETKTTVSGSGNNKSQTTVVVQTPILVNVNGKSQPIILQEKLPKPTSIIVVSSGAKDANIKLNLIKAVQTILDLPSSKIEVFAGK